MMTEEELSRTIYACGICGAYHPIRFMGDCRDDSNRYGGPEDFAERNGLDPDQIEIIEWDELDEWDKANS